MKTLYLTLLAFISLNLTAMPQNFTQNIRGRVTDNASQMPLPGANVILLNSDPVIGTSTDADGYFKITGVPVGRAGISVSFLGYNSATISNLIVTTGKEVFVNIELEETVTTYEEVVVTASKPKSRANNDMALVSARSFTIEETERYAGSRGDVARMASNYAGVSFANDSRNDIVIRGNSPSGLLWRLEDVEIPNPNHFAENGTTGGPVGMLNNNVLRNSDFITGAFPAEYGNAMSGVFDLKMRNGNTEKYEFTVQSGFNGFEVGAEGPISKDNNSSFLIYGRYSTLEVMDKMGFSFGTAGVPKYKDVTFKVNYPTQKGFISVFGVAGASQITMLTKNLSKDDMYNYEGNDLYNRSSMAASGISYTHFFSPRTNLKFTLSGLYQNGGTDIDSLRKDTLGIDTIRFDPDHVGRIIEHDITEYRTTASLTLTSKINSRFTQKVGLSLDLMGFDLDTKVYKDSMRRLVPYMDTSFQVYNGPKLLRSYYELSYKLSDQLSINPGLHFIYFTLSKEALFEPRIGMTWAYARNRSINIGYGLHSRTQALSAYYDGTFVNRQTYYTNLNLDATKSHQFVLGHDWNMSKQLRLKTEAYFQKLFDVPVEKFRSGYSILNTGGTWGPQANDSLTNTGKGYNYGLEITFEKFLSNNYYFLVTTSLFDSKYKGSDDTLRNTSYNGNFVINALFGYEIPINNKWTQGFDIKFTYAGGTRYTPLDTIASAQKRETVYKEYDINNYQFPNFFKLDVKYILRRNFEKSSMEWQIYVENVTNHDNVLVEQYSPTKNKKVTTYQLGIFPMVLWRWNF